MGLKTQAGGRRNQAFCTGSSRHLPGEYLIRNHMVFHYNKINSAKAAVDSSMPKSRLSSIKLADQQNREKLKKKTGRSEEKMNVCEAVSQCCSRDGRRLPPSSKKHAHFLSRAPCAYGKHCLVHSCPVKYTRKCCRHPSRPSHSISSTCVSRPTVKHTGLSRSRSTESFVTVGCSQRCQGNNPKASCKDPTETFVTGCSQKCQGNNPKSSCCGDPTESFTTDCSQRCQGSKPKSSCCGDPTESFTTNCSQRCQGSKPKASCRDSFVTGCSRRCRGNNPKSSCGDLLERHSECFTKSQHPFTPRTLVSDAKSFLSRYRYYTPPRRNKRNHHKQRVEAETQTDMISFTSPDKVYKRKVMAEQQKMASEAEDKRDTLDEPERGIDGYQCCNLRKTSGCPQKSSTRSTVDAEEEELLYLTFIEDITNEILRLGLFSNRVLDQLFESYIEANKNRLDEGKMRRMLDVLKSDLGCGQDSETELIHADQEALDPQEFDKTEELEFTSKGHRLRKATKNEESLETMDLSLKEPSKYESLSWTERSRETHSREESSEDTSETVDAGTECDFCGVEFEEHPDTPRTCEADLNLISCDYDLGISKELDELEEKFADTFHMSRNYS
ncbi:PREDICTED: spermatogenesis-associated protein 7 isoform X2 [Sturnus vulgaris]|uniref:spermatogenesis-associated protein 7 isoform X2 n=1 Tax=Sturnus vulgaris TaxID=9172 RepID=UPI00071AA6BB|nr:PREDICTED: spermatogenesis-associated protein 7 isoform X2 [Sturnus vulgaris]